jgi:predicted O-methyltransferase YrrM
MNGAGVTTELLLDLYGKYRNDLMRVRSQQYWFYKRHENPAVRRLRKLRLIKHMLFPAFDDLEAEITYLLLRFSRPKCVLEMSPNSGWSTTWILSALRDNDNGGQLWSFDLHATCQEFVPQSLSCGRWNFVQGDAKQTIASAPEFDYLFIDSDHSRQFAEWYVGTLFPRIRPGTFVSVHDVFHAESPSEEGEVVIDWLKSNGLPHWTPSKLGAPAENQRILQHRIEIGINYSIHFSDMNPILFFQYH